MKLSPYTAGYDAALEHQSLVDNPYDMSSAEYAEWRKGYTQALQHENEHQNVLEAIYAQGKKDYEACQDVNPYKVHTDEYDAWRDGWNFAQNLGASLSKSSWFMDRW